MGHDDRPVFAPDLEARRHPGDVVFEFESPDGDRVLLTAH